MDNIASIAWPMVRLPEAIEVLARRAGLKPTSVNLGRHPSCRETLSHEDFEQWLDWICAQRGIEMESVIATGADLMKLIHGAGPVLLRYRLAGEPTILLLLKATARHVYLIGPDQEMRRYPACLLQAALCVELERPVTAEVDALLQHANLPADTQAHIARLLVQERMMSQTIEGCWMIRMPPNRPFWLQITSMKLPHRALAMVAIFVTLYLLEIIGWAIIGQGALEGRLDVGWLMAWALLLLGMVPIQLVGTWLQGTFAIDFGTLLKQRLLSGALSMNMDEIRQKGFGQLLGHVIESQALESLALNGGFAVLVAAVELSLAAWVLAWGTGGLWHVFALLLWVAGTFSVSWFYYQRLRRWTRARIGLTHELVEQMVGHRTRIAQEAPEQRHVSEDHSLERFLHLSREFDKAFLPLAWGAPRGWLIVGMLALLPAFIWSSAEGMGLAIGLGGVLLAYRAFGEIGSGLAALARAAVAWETVAPLFKATQHIEEGSTAVSVMPHATFSHGEDVARDVLVHARDLSYRYVRQGEQVLKGCNLTIYRGDRLLIEGSSGGGKSTLGAVLAGLRHPDSGLLMLNGLDRSTLGQTWQRLTTVASQFHENHVMTGPFAFNLLMGRRWPPTVEDMAEAKQLCDELGLGDLLSRMPSGLMQIVGETGWQLSHGERSRLYLARALLQKAELVVLDESFAALDPETLTQCLRCALSRASTLVVIAHP
ncbi:MAG: ABC transporter ATP-binding protein [Nitrospira sp.]|nr:ABC transporter ATP-binding protein [Nitrospira sp.]